MYDAGKIDKGTLRLFSLGKRLSFLLVIISMLAFIISIVKYIGAAPDVLQPPQFNDFAPFLGVTGQRQEDPDFSKIDTKIAVVNKYDSHLKSIITNNRLDTSAYDTIVSWMTATPDHRRTRFISGLSDFLKEYTAWMKSNNKLKEGEEPTNEMYMSMAAKYNRIFIELLKKEEQRQDASFQERTYLLIAIIASLIFLVLFLLVPIGIKIEENTRFFK